MSIAQTIGTILRETFTAPTSGSYVIQTPQRHIVLRQGGIYPNIDLSGCNLSGLDLHGTTFRDATFKNANLTGANLAGADLRGADLDGAIISNAKFDNASVEQASFGNVVFDIPPSGLSIEATHG